MEAFPRDAERGLLEERFVLVDVRLLAVFFVTFLAMADILERVIGTSNDAVVEPRA